MTEIDQTFRPITNNEREILDKLLSINFLGRDELRTQLTRLEAAVLDANGSLRFKVSVGENSPTSRNPVVEIRYLDSGVGEKLCAHVNILLHLKEGKLSMLEVYKDDSTKVTRKLLPDEFFIFSSYQ